MSDYPAAGYVGQAVASTQPVSMAACQDGRVLIVNGLTRGYVYGPNESNYSVLTLIGVGATSAITAATSASPLYHYVDSIVVLDTGANYSGPPAVTVSGVSGVKASLFGDGVASISLVTSAVTHLAPPSVSISSSNQASNAAASIVVRGQVAAVNVAPSSGMYATAPDVTFYSSTSVTAVRAAQGRAVIEYDSLGATTGRLAGIVLTDPGVYEWVGTSVSAGARPVGATVSAPLAGGTPLLTVDSSAAVVSISSSTSGSSYSVAPLVTFHSMGPEQKGDGAIALASLSGTSAVLGYTLLTGGAGYDGRVEARLTSDPAIAVAQLQPRLSGRYLLGVRYVTGDDLPGNVSDLRLVDCGVGASNLVWTIPRPDSITRAQYLELWRTSSDQAITLYRVARLSVAEFDALSPPGAQYREYIDPLSDQQLTDPDRNEYAELPILTADGYPNAQRFGLPPSNMSVVTLFNDRAWYCCDTGLSERNVIYFSGVGEYEAVPSVNQLVIAPFGRECDTITGLIPLGGSLYVGHRKHMVRLTVGDDPLSSASATPVSERGLLNDRCWDVIDGVAYVADAAGVHAFNGSSSEDISAPVSTFWTDHVIDFSKSRWFFLRINTSERVVRFYYTPSGAAGSQATHALCYSLITRAWWVESYGVPVGCGVRAYQSGVACEYLGSSDGRFLKSNVGNTDAGTAISYSLKTGNMPLNKDPKRNVRITYTPSANSLGVRLYYNNSTSPRANAVSSDRGDGFVSVGGSTESTLAMASTRSPLGTASGFAQLSLSGRIDDSSVGGDRCVAVEFAGTAAAPVVIHGVQVEGVG